MIHSEGERLGVTPQLAPSVGSLVHHIPKQWQQQEEAPKGIHSHREGRIWWQEPPQVEPAELQYYNLPPNRRGSNTAQMCP
jgi:hypothetical protein